MQWEIKYKSERHMQLKEFKSSFNVVNSKLLLCVAWLSQDDSFVAFNNKKLLQLETYIIYRHAFEWQIRNIQRDWAACWEDSRDEKWYFIGQFSSKHLIKRIISKPLKGQYWEKSWSSMCVFLQIMTTIYWVYVIN